MRRTEDCCALSFSDMFRQVENIKNAQAAEPALTDQRENSRRERLLEQIAEAAKKGGEGHTHALSLASNMRSNSTADAWDTLAIELAKAGDENWARHASEESDRVRVSVWRSVDSDESLISQITPIGRQFLSVYSSSVVEFKRRLEVMSAYIRPFKAGKEMREYVVNMARFGSMADDWMVRSVIEMLYLERGLFEEVCDICALVLRFKGYDRDRMRASTLVEDVINKLLGHLQRCEEPGHVDHMISRELPISPQCKDGKYLDKLKRTCLKLLKRRARSLGLRIQPDPGENNLLRKASNFSLDVRARRQMHRLEDVVAYIQEYYPASYAFLNLCSPRVLKKMAKNKGSLMQNVSSQIESHRIARIRNVEHPGKTALDTLEPMLKFRQGREDNIPPKTLKKWRGGIVGDQLWEYIFEMDICLRLVRGGMDVKVDPSIQKAGVKEGDKTKVEVDLEIDGCLAELYAPLDTEIFVHDHVTRIDDPGTKLMYYVLAKSQLGHVRKRKAVVIVGCSGGDFANVKALRNKLKLQLGNARQPGAIFFTHDDGVRDYVECIVNPKAVTKIPKQTILAIQKSLERGKAE